MAVITSAGSGAWNSTTPNAPWPSGTVPGSADNVTIASGHTVTTTATMAALDLTINGIFQWSRSVSATLTLQRNFTVNNSGTWDMGADASPIPSGVNHTVILNDQNSAVDAQRLSAFLNACGATFVGVPRTRNARLTAEAASGQPVIVVNDATGWASGDQLVIIGNTTASSTNQVTTISSISGTTITLAANLAEIKRVDTAVGNFSSNLVFRSNQANAGAIRFLVNGGSASGQAQYVKNTLFLDGGISSGTPHPSARAALGTINSQTYQPLQTIESCAFFRTASGTADAINLAIAQARRISSRVANCAIYSPTATGMYIADSVTDLTVENTSIYQAGLNFSLFMGFSAGCFGAKFTNGLIKSSGHSSLTPGANLVFEGVTFISDASIFAPVAAGKVELKSCIFNKIGSYDLPGSGQGLLNIDAGSVGDFQVSNASFGASITHATLSSLATGPRPVFSLKDITAYKSFNNAGGREVDTSIVNLGANSLRLSPVSTTNKLRQDISITIPTVALKVAGVLRKNSTYGASNRPFVQISGSTISTQTFTMTDSTDTWESFVLSAAASGAGTVVFRVQAENSNVASRAYLADLQIRAFGYEQASLPLLNPTIDLVTIIIVPTITSGNATSAAAITGIAINFSTSTITVSSARTIEQLINYHEVQWAETLGANRLFTANNLSTITTAATISLGATLTGNVTTTGNIAITVAGNYSSTNATLASSSTLTVPNGTTTLGGWVFASGATVSGSGSAIVEVDANQIANITASGGVIVRSVPVIFSGFPTGNNVNAVPFSSVIAIRNTSDSTLFTASASSGSVAVSLSTIGNGVGPFLVWGDGRGVRRTIEQSITVNRADDVSFSGLFEEYVNEFGQVLVGLAAADSGVTYDAGNTRFLFASASSTFLGVLHQFDLLTSTEAGQAYNNDAVRGIRFVQNAFVRTIFLPSPFTIAATADSPTARTLIDCRIIRPDGSDARAYGLASTVYAGDRPIVAFPFAVQEYVGLTAQAARDSLKLAPTAGSPAAGSVDADLDTLVARNNALDAAGTRSAVGLGSANLDTQLGAIDTVVDAILVDTDATIPAQITARTLAAADYFDPATDTVANVTTVGTVTNKTGYSLSDGAITPAKIQDGAFTSAKFAAGAFDAVWTAATRTLTAIADSSGVTTLLSRIGSALTITSGAVTVGTNNDKTGYSLTTPPLDSTATQAAAASALTAYDPPTRAELTSDIGTVTGAIAGLNNLSAAQVNAEVDAALADYDGPTKAELDSAVAGLATSSALATVDGVVDAILDDTGTTIPALIADVPTVAEFEARTIPAADYFVVSDYTAPANGDIAAIKAKTDNLPSDPADQSAVEGAITAATSGLATTANITALNNLSAAQVNAEVDTALADVGLTPTVTGRIDAAISSRLATAGYAAPANSDITAIKAKTDNLPSDPADQSQVEAAITAATSGLATSSSLSTLTTTVGTAGAGLTNIPKTGYSLSAGGIQAIWDALTSALTTSGSVGKRIADFLNASVAAIPTSDNSANITAIKAKTDPLTFTTANRVDSTAITVSDKTGYALSGTQAFNLTGNVTGNLSGSVGSVTGNVGGTVATVTTLTNLPTIPNNWITAAGIATDAIGADELAASAITKIQSGLATTSQLNSIQGAGFNTATDSLEALRDRGDSAWVTANISGLATSAALTTLGAAVDLIKAKTDLLTFTGSDVRATLDGETVSVGDKTGFSLTSGERTAIATAVEAALINEGDGQQLINAILQVINANLDLPALELTAIAQAVRSELATELGRIDAAITSRLATAGYNAPDNAGITTLQTRLSSLRAGYLDKLDVSGTLAHTNNANTFKADTAPVLSAIALIPTNPLLASSYTAPDNANIGLIKAKTDTLPSDPADQSAVEAAITAATSGLSTLTAAQVWVYSGGDRSLSGAQATAITSAATLAQVQAAGFTTDRHNALVDVDARVEKLFKRQGLLSGVTATVKSAETDTPGFLTTSDDDIDQVLTKNVDGSVTVSNA